MLITQEVTIFKVTVVETCNLNACMASNIAKDHKFTVLRANVCNVNFSGEQPSEYHLEDSGLLGCNTKLTVK
jgi:hypothetical protein